jgi:hypothetical protein
MNGGDIMIRKSNLRFRHYAVSCLLILAWVAIVPAGGFQLEVEAVGSSTDPQLKGAVLIVRTYGCRIPRDAKLVGTAEGLVKGQRQSLPIRFTPTSTGVYAIKQQWPTEGVWVLAITGYYGGITSSALVEMEPESKSPRVQIVQRKLHPDEIETALRILTSKVAKNTRASK